MKSRMRYALEGLRASLARDGIVPEETPHSRSALP